MRGVAILLSLALTGCSFDASVLTSGSSKDGAPDVGDGDGSVPPADSGPPNDVPLGEFSAPTPIGGLVSIFGDDDPSLTADLLELYFSSDRAGSEDIWVTRRTSVGQAWPAPTAVDELNTPSSDGEPQVSADGLTLYFASTRPGGSGGFDIWRSTRAARSDPWSAPENLTGLNTASADLHASSSADDLVLVFNSTRDDNGYDLYEATRANPNATWNNPQAVGEINTAQNDSNTSITPDGLVIVIDSDRPGTIGNRDLWISSRPDRQSNFSAPVALTELNSTGRDSDPWLSPDQRYIVFSSDRNGSKAVYQASR